MTVEVEVAPGAEPAPAAALAADRLRDALGLTVPVTPVSAGVLPRFEMKARRFVVEATPSPTGPSTSPGNP